MALTKADMAERLFEDLGINKREAKDLVEIFFEEIRGALERGRQVKLSGFGNFDLRDKNHVRAAIPRPARKSLSPPGGSSLSGPDRNSRRGSILSRARRNNGL
jgi:nucleoid DNA-binding protein